MTLDRKTVKTRSNMMTTGGSATLRRTGSRATMGGSTMTLAMIKMPEIPKAPKDTKGTGDGDAQSLASSECIEEVIKLQKNGYVITMNTFRRLMR